MLRFQALWKILRQVIGTFNRSSSVKVHVTEDEVLQVIVLFSLFGFSESSRTDGRRHLLKFHAGFGVVPGSSISIHLESLHQQMG